MKKIKLTKLQSNLLDFLKKNPSYYVECRGYYNHNFVKNFVGSRVDGEECEKNNIRGFGECLRTVEGLFNKGYLLRWSASCGTIYTLKGSEHYGSQGKE